MGIYFTKYLIFDDLLLGHLYICSTSDPRRSSFLNPKKCNKELIVYWFLAIGKFI
jgi:hypothetical protein